MGREHGSAIERMGIDVTTGMLEVGRHETAFQVDKWDIEQVHWVRQKNTRDYIFNPEQEPDARWFGEFRCDPFEVYRKEDCNLITDAGWTMIMNGIAGSAVTKFVNATTGRIGLGVTGTAPTYADAALASIGALTTANWKVINAVPTVGNHTTGLILAAQFGLTEANGVAILEFATDLGVTSTLSTAAVGLLFSRGTASPGTKTNVQVWNATVTATWT